MSFDESMVKSAMLETQQCLKNIKQLVVRGIQYFAQGPRADNWLDWIHPFLLSYTAFEDK